MTVAAFFDYLESRIRPVFACTVYGEPFWTKQGHHKIDHGGHKDRYN